jgi:hypothetical protein
MLSFHQSLDMATNRFARCVTVAVVVEFTGTINESSPVVLELSVNQYQRPKILKNGFRLSHTFVQHSTNRLIGR